jgi:hypothetical protein
MVTGRGKQLAILGIILLIFVMILMSVAAIPYERANAKAKGAFTQPEMLLVMEESQTPDAFAWSD